MRLGCASLATVAALAVAGFGFLPLPGTLSARAAAGASAVPTLSAPTEGTKVILGDTSIDGPALWTITGSAPNGPPRSILAWTGTDPAHHLNYMTSTDGLHYGNKQILGETSIARPSVSEQIDFEGGPQFIVLAWTGTDPNHSLNVLYIDATTNQPVTKLILPESSFTAPAVAVHCCAGASELKLAFAGTDARHTLNVITISADRKVTGTTFLSGTSSRAAPYLNDGDPTFTTWLLSWADLNSRINFATLPTSGSATWTVQPALGEFSNAGPSMISTSSASQPNHWLAWAGTFRDTAHHLNVQFTTSFPSWPSANAKTTFGETCLAGPTMGSIDVNGKTTLVAWTGTDVFHSLNVAVISVGT